MNVKELREQLKFAKDEDIVYVEFPDLETGGHDTSNDVQVVTTKGSVTIIAEYR